MAFMGTGLFKAGKRVKKKAAVFLFGGVTAASQVIGMGWEGRIILLIMDGIHFSRLFTHHSQKIKWTLFVLLSIRLSLFREKNAE